MNGSRGENADCGFCTESTKAAHRSLPQTPNEYSTRPRAGRHERARGLSDDPHVQKCVGSARRHGDNGWEDLIVDARAVGRKRPWAGFGDIEPVKAAEFDPLDNVQPECWSGPAADSAQDAVSRKANGEDTVLGQGDVSECDLLRVPGAEDWHSCRRAVGRDYLNGADALGRESEREAAIDGGRGFRGDDQPGIHAGDERLDVRHESDTSRRYRVLVFQHAPGGSCWRGQPHDRRLAERFDPQAPASDDIIHD